MVSRKYGFLLVLSCFVSMNCSGMVQQHVIKDNAGNQHTWAMDKYGSTDIGRILSAITGKKTITQQDVTVMKNAMQTDKVLSNLITAEAMRNIECTVSSEKNNVAIDAFSSLKKNAMDNLIPLFSGVLFVTYEQAILKLIPRLFIALGVASSGIGSWMLYQRKYSNKNYTNAVIKKVQAFSFTDLITNQFFQVIGLGLIGQYSSMITGSYTSIVKSVGIASALTGSFYVLMYTLVELNKIYQDKKGSYLEVLILGDLAK